MRARSLKPGFFQNEDLAELEPLARILFEGLWCIADREGRLEDRPKRIKAAVLPYDNCDAERMLQDLADHNFIVRYAVDGQHYIQVVNFLKHQTPHLREIASEIPEAPGWQKAQPRQCLSTTQAVPEPDPGDAEALPRSPGTGIPEPGTRNLEPEPGTRNPEPGAPAARARARGAPDLTLNGADQLEQPDPGTPLSDEQWEREQLREQLKPISAEFDDNRPASSVTRVHRLMHSLKLSPGDMANAIKEAQRATRNRRDALNQPRIDAPMPWFLGTLESCAKARAPAAPPDEAAALLGAA